VLGSSAYIFTKQFGRGDNCHRREWKPERLLEVKTLNINIDW
jgi:hypothetical protein